jgi:hypothetical protein
LTVIDAGWRAEIPHDTSPATIVVASRWIAPENDLSADRALVAALARAYFRPSRGQTGAQVDFVDGVAHYVATRAINDLFDGRHALTSRYFGGFVPVVARAVSLSRPRRDARPIIRSYDALDPAASAPQLHRAADLLHTLERFIGWPSLQQVLLDFAADARRGPAGAAEFSAALNRHVGHDMSWFFEDALDTTAAYDWGIAAVTTTRARDGEQYETMVTVRRYGDAFRHVDRLGHVVTRFADGTDVRERWDGAVDEEHFAYTSPTPAVSAAVDPDTVFLLDANRTNNALVLHVPFSSLAARHALNWMTWLQHLALTYTALV